MNKQVRFVHQDVITADQDVASVAVFDANGAPVDIASGGSSIGAATPTVNGTVKQAAAQADSTATDVAGLVSDFNALLAKLRTAGILATA